MFDDAKFPIFLTDENTNCFPSQVMIICLKFDCSKNLLDTILLLLDTVRAIIFFLVNCSTAVGNLLSCRINWIRAIYIFCVNCSNCRPIYIRTVDTVKTDINFAQIAITPQKIIFKNESRCYVRLDILRQFKTD